MKTVSEHLIPYRSFLTQEKQRLTDTIRQLENQQRQDEANLFKIRLNIVSVFDTVAAADEKQAASWQDFILRYEPRFDTLPAPWRTRLAAAKAHGDIQTQTIEEEKLDEANQLYNVFVTIKE